MSIRVNTMSYTYSQISKEHYKIANDYYNKCCQLEIELKNYEFGSPNYHYKSFELDENEMMKEKASLVCIVFVCMALEAFIYDYSARSFSDTYVKNYMDKMDLLSKYVIIPKLVSGNEINKEGQAFQLLNEVIRIRNKIVHTKSKPCNSMDQLLELTVDLEINYFEYAKKSLDLIYKLSTELDEIDSNAMATLCFGTIKVN